MWLYYIFSMLGLFFVCGGFAYFYFRGDLLISGVLVFIGILVFLAMKATAD